MIFLDILRKNGATIFLGCIILYGYTGKILKTAWTQQEVSSALQTKIDSCVNSITESLALVDWVTNNNQNVNIQPNKGSVQAGKTV